MTGPDNDDVAEMELKAKQDMQRAAISSAVMVEDAAIADAVNLPDGDSAVAMAIGDLGAIKTQLATTKTERDAKVPASLRAAAIGSALAGHLCVLHRGHVRPDPAVFLALSAFPILFVRPRATAMPRPRLVPWATSRDQTAPPPASRIVGLLFVDRLRRAPHLAIHRGRRRSGPERGAGSTWTGPA